MTDGPTLSTNDGSGRFFLSNSPASDSTRQDILDTETTQALRDPHAVALNNYAAWLELQSLATIANIIDVTANELYRRQEWTTIAGQVKDAGKDLRAGAR